MLFLFPLLFAPALSQDPIPWLSFVSRPDILAPVLDVRIYNENAISPGYIFLSTWHDSELLNGPYIYSNEGELIWSGHNPSLPKTKYFNFQAHQFTNGTSVLSVFRGDSDHGRGKGHVELFDTSYHFLRTIEAPSGGSLDFHEFQLQDDGRTALVVALMPKQADLSIHGIVDGIGWLLDSVFYRIDLETNQVLFEWHASDHVPLNESVLPPSKHRFAGMAYHHAYDFFHINSISTFSNGDYLLSARHTDTLYRISAINGSILWRLGGLASSFTLLDNLNFSAQHNAQILEESLTHLTLALFDNAYNGETATSNTSSAITISVDLRARSARLINRLHPMKPGLAQNQGSAQTLPNENIFVSWGLIAEFSEFLPAPNNERVLDVAFADETMRAYRVRKYNFTAFPPESEIAVHIYSRRDSGASTWFWMSWNGATEVKEWRVFDATGKRKEIGRVGIEGFETGFGYDGDFVSRGYVEALDADGRVLGRSKVVETVVPPESLRGSCGEEHCVLQVFVGEEEEEVVEEEERDEVENNDDDGGWRNVRPRERWCEFPVLDLSWINVVTAFVIGVLVGRIANGARRVFATLVHK